MTTTPAGAAAAVGRHLTLVAGVTAAAVALAAVLSLTAPSVHRAESKLVVTVHGAPVTARPAPGAPYTATLEDLVRSDVVATNVVQSLRLGMSSHELLSRLSTSSDPKTAVIEIAFEDGSRARAVRVVQQVDSVFARLVAARFGRMSLAASVFDPAHGLPGRVSPRPARDIAIGGVIGLALGALAAVARESRRPRTAAAAPAPRGPAPQVAALEKLLRNRDSTIERLRAELRDAQLHAPPAPPEPVAQPPDPRHLLATAGRFDLAALEDAVARDRDHPRADEWNAYLPLLRAQADAAGMLPPEFDGLVHDVFGDLLGRIRSDA
ncbi:MAG TPA: hypothetical protein VI408_13740 [Gaiellaceae bacterium]